MLNGLKRMRCLTLSTDSLPRLSFSEHPTVVLMKTIEDKRGAGTVQALQNALQTTKKVLAMRCSVASCKMRDKWTFLSPDLLLVNVSLNLFPLAGWCLRISPRLLFSADSVVPTPSLRQGEMCGGWGLGLGESSTRTAASPLCRPACQPSLRRSVQDSAWFHYHSCLRVLSLSHCETSSSSLMTRF